MLISMLWGRVIYIKCGMLLLQREKAGMRGI
jgi:hypothetical protein